MMFIFLIGLTQIYIFARYYLSKAKISVSVYYGSAPSKNVYALQYLILVACGFYIT